VVRLYQGRFDRVTDYGDDPVAWARRFREAGARSVHLVDLTAARGERPFAGEGVAEVAALGLAVEVAGGIRSPAQARRAVALGAARVVVGSAAEDPERLQALLAAVGPERLVVALDARGGRLQVEGWEKPSRWTLEERLEALAAEGVRRIAYTDVARDGTLSGPDWEAVPVLVASGFHVTVAGGVRRLDELRRLAELGVAAAVVGRAVYEGTLALEEAFRL
jgi:phosphoribosylformimino-5-aminoimidazole carboxamide ribotide isomerase